MMAKSSAASRVRKPYNFMNHKPTTNSELRKRRHARVRALVKGTAERPRLAVFRSNRFVSAQLIDDTVGKTLVSAHGREFPGALEHNPSRQLLSALQSRRRQRPQASKQLSLIAADIVMAVR